MKHRVCAGLVLAALGALAIDVAPGKGWAAEPDLAYVKKIVDEHSKMPVFVAPGPAFNAKACMTGKMILSVPVSSSIPFIENIETAMKEVAPTVGFSITEWSNQGQPTQWIQGVDRAINGKFDALDLFGGINPALMEPQVMAAKKAGLPVLSSHYSDTTQPPAPNVDVTLALPYHDVGEIIASWIIQKTGGKANVLIIGSDENYPVPIYVDKMKTTFEKYCGAGCSFKVVNVPIPEWSSKIQTTVQAALNADPKINYIVPVFDSMIQFVTPALTLTGRKGQVKIASFNGTPFVIDLIQKGEVEMDVGESLGWIARSTLDGYMRKLCGLPTYTALNVPLYIFSAANAKDAGAPADFDKGFGDQHIAGFNALWGIH